MRFLTLFFIFLVPILANDGYVISFVKGNVMVSENSVTQKARNGMKVSESAVFTIPEKASLEISDKSSRFSMKKSGTYTFSEILKQKAEANVVTTTTTLGVRALEEEEPGKEQKSKKKKKSQD